MQVIFRQCPGADKMQKGDSRLPEESPLNTLLKTLLNRSAGNAAAALDPALRGGHKQAN